MRVIPTEKPLLMSRKESGMPFVVYSSPKKNEQGENLQYVMPVPGNKVTLDEIDAICAEQSMLRKGELTQAFTAFAEAVRRLLADGKRVETKIGTFMPQLKLRQPMTDAESIDAGDVRLAGIGFEPKKEFVESVRSQTRGFRKFDVTSFAYSVEEKQYDEYMKEFDIEDHFDMKALSDFKKYRINVTCKCNRKGEAIHQMGWRKKSAPPTT